jgi:hypothetical protein
MANSGDGLFSDAVAAGCCYPCMLLPLLLLPLPLPIYHRVVNVN